MFYRLVQQRKAGRLYRGMDRGGAMVEEALPDDESTKRLVDQYWAHYAYGFPAVEPALALARGFDAVGVHLEVLGIEQVDRDPEGPLPGELGFDIANLLWSVLTNYTWPSDWTEAETGPDRVLYRLIECYFRSRLNTNGLFPTWSDARFFWDAEIALGELTGRPYESPDVMEAIDIYRVVLIERDTEA